MGGERSIYIAQGFELSFDLRIVIACHLVHGELLLETAEKPHEPVGILLHQR